MNELIVHFNYLVCVVILMIGLYTMLASQHLMKKLIGLALFQSAISLFYISMGHIDGGTAPILVSPNTVGAEQVIYSNPLPHVLILTAIVVGVATLAVGLALVSRINHAYGTLEEDEINASNRARSE